MIITKNPIYDRVNEDPILKGYCPQCECSFECNYGEILNDTEDGYIAECPCCNQKVKVHRKPLISEWFCVCVYGLCLVYWLLMWFHVLFNSP